MALREILLLGNPTLYEVGILTVQRAINDKSIALKSQQELLH